jgi:hypothetical protein
MGKETESIAISNGDSTNPIQVSVVVCDDDNTKNWVVVCNPDWTEI